MTSPLPPCFDTATKWWSEIPGQWEAVQFYQDNPENVEKRKKVGIVDVKYTYHIAADRIATMEMEYAWKADTGAINFYAYYCPRRDTASLTMISVTYSHDHPLPQLSLQASLPGSKLSDFFEIPSEIAEIGNYVIDKVVDNTAFNTFELQLKH